VVAESIRVDEISNRLVGDASYRVNDLLSNPTVEPGVHDEHGFSANNEAFVVGKRGI
jgi:hypothetical protein